MIGRGLNAVKLLIADDDRDLVDLLTFALKRAGFDTSVAFDAPMALQAFEKEAPDLIVLDVNLGSASGFDVLKELRRKTRNPVIMLTARDNEGDIVTGLELGADDYVTKPFSYRELIARIRAALRRSGREWVPPDAAKAVLQTGSLVLDAASHTVTVEGRKVDLTVTEFRLLHYLMTNQGTAVPIRAILRHVWGYEDPMGSQLVRVTVHRLRRKLKEPANRPRYVHTVPGVGFMVKGPGDK